MSAIGYFTAEIGLWSDLHTYSGGLGVLAGDHVKSAADAEIPLIGVTLLYREGYSRQHLDSDGVQSETYPVLDPSEFLEETAITIEIPLDNQTIYARVWRANIVGQTGHKVPVYFLDTTHENNSQYHQEIGQRLYGGDDDTRIRQEYLLGVGGIQLFDHLQIELKGIHLNEGHCTFAMLELLSRGWSREELAQNSLFTTHTPVPAGHDRFDWSLVREIMGEKLPEDAQELVRNAGDSEGGNRCSMSHLAVALSTSVNAVSILNAEVAETMFSEMKIRPITNGVHHPTWTSSTMTQLFDEYLPNWKANPTQLNEARNIPVEALRQARNENRKLLRKLVKEETGVEFEEHRLTIGFARRFATYKRANLVFHDLEKLREIGAGKIQFVFSGKAHPKDEGGKQLIRDIFASAKTVEEEIPVAFIENYNMDTGLAMTSGVDIWLNNPIRPLEASGTSGMKAAMNGVPNCSILDGWWPEACKHGINGWAIGNAEDDRNDPRDAANIYSTLQNDVLPSWERKDETWANLMRESIASSAGFTGQRMIEDYLHFYNKFN
ncbi:MAG: alpha-glucan family phosphorylase [Euryarchaeota archaeon]|nr:alpha-glucan family phosphorylase [Euryarchaeota archaeon]